MAKGKKELNNDALPEGSEKRSRKESMPWMGGVVLILIGLVFLLRQVSGFELDNWWALFILIPAMGSFGTAWNAYQNAGGKFTLTVRGSLIGGLVMTLVAAIFLFNLNWALFLPFILILAGVGILASTFLGS